MLCTLNHNYKNTKILNISKITRMVNVVYKYLDLLEPGITEIFKTEFKKIFRSNTRS